MSGVLYGLGVGPGDPELITLKAYRILQNIPVIAYSAPQKGNSLAYQITTAHIPKNIIEIAMRIPMTSGPVPMHDIYDHHAAEITKYLKTGYDVAVLCIGDPFFYSSFIYLYDRLAEKFTIQIVPGVSCLTACFAVAGLPLSTHNETLVAVPATLDEIVLLHRLKDAEAIAITKIGQHMAKVKRVLARLSLLDRSLYVEKAGMAAQKITPLTKVSKAPYFSMVIVHRKREIG